MLTSARARVLEALRAAPEPITARELGDRLHLHPTTVRFHLDRLVAEGLVTTQLRRQGGRGRPATCYLAVPQANPDAAEVWIPLIEALASALEAQGPRGHANAVAAGTTWAQQILDDHRDGGHDHGANSDNPDQFGAEALRQLLSRLGFSPTAAPWGLSLASCPFIASARRHPHVVCAVHLGLSRGLLGRLGPNTPGRVELRPFAEPGACHLVFGPEGPNNPGEDDPSRSRPVVPPGHVEETERTSR
ncbi:Predicted transcriptional regulator, ArsR family [Propionibacterium cyclohexanicum]|uniref:Predicted transcriptional regulator, ArsR family n=2 Tax=Propionibacterium cyclohexanicum TaxID=64702 RepID=A0A1H9RIV2_9ACTN|nr:Predicted transcriptional regulator, ArsR family [Propionibacterium cyclohexanicum]